MSRRGHGMGSIFQRESDGMWVGRVELPPGPDGKRRRKQVARARRAEVVTALRDLRRDLDRTGDLPTSSPTLAVWLTTWLDRIAAPRLKPRTTATYRSYIEHYITPSIGRTRLDKLTPGHVARMHAYITEQGLSSTTALQAHRILSRALVDAMREGRVTRNVADADHIDAPRRAVTTRRALTATDAQAILGLVATPGREREFIRWSLALLAGLRQGEALGLTRDCIDLDAGLLRIEWQLQRLPWSHGCGPRTDTGWPCQRERAGSCSARHVTIPAGQEAERVHGGLWLLRPKSRRGWREVPIVGAFRDGLARYMAQAEPGPAGLLLHDAGRPLDPSRDSAAWHALLVEAGIDRAPLHSARHTTATLLYELGVPEGTRMAILGHSSATTTAGYTHVTDAIARDAMERLGRVALPQIGD